MKQQALVTDEVEEESLKSVANTSGGFTLR